MTLEHEKKKLDITPYIAIAVARNDKSYKRVEAFFKLNRTACYAAALQSSYTGHFRG